MADCPSFTPIQLLPKVATTLPDDFLLLSRNTTGATPSLVITDVNSLAVAATAAPFTGNKELFSPNLASQFYVKTDISPNKLFFSFGTGPGDLSEVDKTSGVANYTSTPNVSLSYDDPTNIVISPSSDISFALPVAIAGACKSFVIVISGGSTNTVTLQDPTAGPIVNMRDQPGEIARVEAFLDELQVWQVSAFRGE